MNVSLLIVVLTLFLSGNADININVPHSTLGSLTHFNPFQPRFLEPESVQAAAPSFSETNQNFERNIDFVIQSSSIPSIDTTTVIQTELLSTNEKITTTTTTPTPEKFPAGITDFKTESNSMPSVEATVAHTEVPLAHFRLSDLLKNEKVTKLTLLTNATKGNTSTVEKFPSTTTSNEIKIQPIFKRQLINKTEKKINIKNECGVQATANRIIGGNETSIDEFPWLALFYYKTPKNKLKYKCGGTLIKSRTIITAAHCLEGALRETLEFIRLGEWNTATEVDCDTTGLQEDCSDPPVDFRVKGI